MTSPALFSAAAPPITSPLSTATNNRFISPASFACPSDRSPKVRNNNKSYLRHRIKSSASESTATIGGLNPAADTGEEENPVRIGARVRVKVPLTVYHIPKVPEVDLNGKEGKVKENVAVWRGKQISANFPIKIEFLEKLEGRGDAPVRFFAHLREDEFDYID
ncbi:hypothetical protein SSX86_006918 [Deinandra increscens subsp. villosa]|uniref:Ferredoxin thioredoxin reductase alpha chain domain-containing protein n=1 Tax=Deinandra increscens subsp. villosa TaxID=3103831 RepID=A0AAP0DFS2_9ASTR